VSIQEVSLSVPSYHPPDQVQQFTGATLVIDLGIEDFGDSNSGSSSTMMAGGGGAGLNWGSGLGGGFQQGGMEHRVYGSEAVREPLE